MRRSIGAVLWLWVAGVTACGAPDNGHGDALRPEIGFVDLPSDTASVDGVALESAPARIFYALRPARDNPESAPLIVLHAGGPGGSMMFVLVYGTGARVVSPSGELVDNHALDDADLLYLDARQAGYSYAEMDDPSDDATRAAEFDAGSFNPYQDAADFLRALFAVFEMHPTLAERDVFFMGESYGGLRNTVTLNLLLHSSEYDGVTRRFGDPALLQAMRRQFQRVLGTETPTPDAVTRWIRGQILLEPWFAGVRQERIEGTLLEEPGSPLDSVAVETGVPYVRCGSDPTCVPFDNAMLYLNSVYRSAYDLRAPGDWSVDHAARVAAVATQRDSLAAVLDVSPEVLDSVLDLDRSRAYRFADARRRIQQPQGDLETHWGSVPAWDAYFVDINRDVYDAFLGQDAQALAVDPNQEAWGELFVENLRNMPTLLTRAEDDLVIYGPAIAPTIASYPGVAGVTEDASTETLNVAYTDGSSVSFRAPRYSDCSHSVLRDQSAALFADVKAFLADVRK